MNKREPMKNEMLRNVLSALGIALLSSTAACTFLVDRNREQCQNDSECAAFGNHPYCRNGVCVASGLGPAGCFFGAPQTQTNFQNACTTAQCLTFDDCSRAGLCNTDGGIPDMLVAPANLGAIPPPINNEMLPTINCVDPSRPNIIYVTGSTNFPPLLQAVQPLLTAGTPSYTAVFLPQTSCKGAAALFDPDPTKHLIKNITGNWAYFYGTDGTKQYCLLDPAGNTVDVGESDVFAQSCSYSPAAQVADYPGPIQAVTFVVPAGSSQRSISAEAAHLVFGTGGNGGAVAPWTDPTLYFVRSSGTGTIQLPSRAINVPATGWWGLDRLSADNLRDSMEGVDPLSAEKAIGVLSSDFADRARANLRVLMFQGPGQSCGFLPDSTPTSFDKANVRDGHYGIWGPIHLFAMTNNGVPSQAADALVTRFSVPRLDQKLLDAIIASGYTPSCAMRVQRTEEMGPLSSFQPRFGCGCYFSSKVDGKSSCQACNGSADCPTSQPACNYGYCEVQ